MILFKGKDHEYSVAEREAFNRTIKQSLPPFYVYLQTCNRIELYAGDGSIPPNIAKHLFRVTAGLESKMIGETHIQGQVKRAYIEAVDNRHISPGLHRLFQAALRAGKRVRSETGISRGAITHSQATIALLKREVSELSQKRIIVIGSHHLNENIIIALHSQGCNMISVTNRTSEKAVAMASQIGCRTFYFDNLEVELKSADIIITATSSPCPIITPDIVPTERHLFMVDLAVPRDVDERLSLYKNVRVFNIEDVEDSIDQNIEARSHEMLLASMIIEEEVRKMKYKMMGEPVLC
ncbi:MAG: glutamyl-tRNA reductase [Planctomycetes bacterium RBG_16_43_13]|nr:MAG: glutamyl-tRNA reductase [Planctomycetes bacterium RBG_16_43_13]